MAKIFKNAIVSTEKTLLNQLDNEKEPELIESPECQSLELLQKEAYNQGYLARKTEEEIGIQHELNQLKQQVETMLLSIPQAVAANRLELNKEIADIVLFISQQFFITQQTDKKALAQQITQILTQLNEKQNVELYLHPQEVAALQNGTIQLETTHLNGLTIKGDESLTLGGYVIKTEHGMFDVSIEKQIDKLKEVLLQIKQGGNHASLA